MCLQDVAAETAHGNKIPKARLPAGSWQEKITELTRTVKVLQESILAKIGESSTTPAHSSSSPTFQASPMSIVTEMCHKYL